MIISNVKSPEFPLVNSDNTDWSNRLTVFCDGEVRIEEVHSGNSISRMQHEGDAFSFALPDVVFENDFNAIKELIEGKSFDDLAKLLNHQGIQELVCFFGDYIDCSYESAATDEEMMEMVDELGPSVERICSELQAANTYVNLEGWVESWIESNQEDQKLPIATLT